MTAKRAYIVVVILAGISLGLFLVNVPLVYGLYGYSTDVIGSSNFEAFAAARDTYPIRSGIFLAAGAIDFVCFVFSLVNLFLQVKVSRILVWVTCCLSFVLLVFYGLAYMVSQIGSACC